MIETPIKKKRGRPKGGAGGKQKGGNETVILDPIISPYKIYVDVNQYMVVDKDKKNEADLMEKSYGYFSKLSFALEKIVKLKIVNNKSYTLKEYIAEYNQMLNSFREKFNIN